MSNLTLFQQGGLPAHIRKATDSAALAAELPKGGLFRILSAKGLRFTIKESGEEIKDKRYVKAPGPIPVVILQHAKAAKRVFFTSKYVEGSDAEPDCVSDNGVSPRGDCANPQSDTCATCPQNAWGSRISNKGKQARACQERRDLVVAIADERLIIGAEPMICKFSVPGGSLKSLGMFADELAKHGVSYRSVICELSFADDQSIAFNAVDFVQPDEQESIDVLMETRGKEIDNMLVWEESVPAAEAPAAAPAPAPRRTAPVQQQAAQEEAPAPAPAPRRSRPAPVEEAPAPAPRRTRTAPAAVATAPAPAPRRANVAAAPSVFPKDEPAEEVGEDELSAELLGSALGATGGDDGWD